MTVRGLSRCPRNLGTQFGDKDIVNFCFRIYQILYQICMVFIHTNEAIDFYRFPKFMGGLIDLTVGDN